MQEKRRTFIRCIDLKIMSHGFSYEDLIGFAVRFGHTRIAGHVNGDLSSGSDSVRARPANDFIERPLGVITLYARNRVQGSLNVVEHSPAVLWDSCSPLRWS